MLPVALPVVAAPVRLQAIAVSANGILGAGSYRVGPRGGAARRGADLDEDFFAGAYAWQNQSADQIFRSESGGRIYRGVKTIGGAKCEAVFAVLVML